MSTIQVHTDYSSEEPNYRMNQFIPSHDDFRPKRVMPPLLVDGNSVPSRGLAKSFRSTLAILPKLAHLPKPASLTF